jgi:hypothetical protein
MNENVTYFSSHDALSLGKATEEWSEKYPQGGAFVLVAESNMDVVPSLQRIFSEHDLPLIGGVAPKLIVGGSLRDEGVLIFFIKHMVDYKLIQFEPEQNSDSIANQITSSFIYPSDESKKTLFLLFDALVPNIASTLDSLYLEIADAVHYVGANMGSETFQPTPCLFDNNSFIQNGVLCFFMECGHTVLKHGYQMQDMEYPATATSGNRISSVDWRPASEVYQELILAKYGTFVSRDNFYSMGVHFPFGIIRMDDEPLVRIPVAMEEDGSLVCVGEIRENAIITVLQAVEPGNLETVDRIAEEFPKAEADSAVLFYCAGRLQHMGDHAGPEIAALVDRLAPLPVHGALSLGEIGCSRQGSYPYFHNATLVTIPWRSV